MANRRSTRGGFRGGGRRAPTTWARTISTAQITVAAGTKVVFATFALANPGIGETVRRTRGQFYIASDQGSVIETQQAAMGMIVVNDLALAAGAASIPGPATDANDDGWFVWMGLLARQGLSASTLSSQNNFFFDSKAMRKVQQGFGIAVMFENIGPFGMVVMGEISMLTSLS